MNILHAIPIASIWAQDTQGIIGSGTRMLWHVPEDFRHFKSQTMSCPIIMGRSSWEAIGGPLPGRENIVLTSQRDYDAQGAHVCSSFIDAIITAHSLAPNGKRIWITGGSKVYTEAMPYVSELVVTNIDLDLQADGCVGPYVYAPHIDFNVWKVDPSRSDSFWRPQSGDAQWKVTTFIRS